MRKYVLKKGERYVSNSEFGYTTVLENACHFTTKHRARNCAARKEQVVPIEIIMKEVKQ